MYRRKTDHAVSRFLVVASDADFDRRTECISVNPRVRRTRCKPIVGRTNHGTDRKGVIVIIALRKHECTAGRAPGRNYRFFKLRRT